MFNARTQHPLTRKLAVDTLYTSIAMRRERSSCIFCSLKILIRAVIIIRRVRHILSFSAEDSPSSSCASVISVLKFQITVVIIPIEMYMFHCCLSLYSLAIPWRNEFSLFKCSTTVSSLVVCCWEGHCVFLTENNINQAWIYHHQE